MNYLKMINLTSIYNHSPIFIQNLAISIFGLKLNKLRFTQRFNEHLDSLIDTDFSSKESLLLVQQNLLELTLVNAVTNIPYYNQLFKNDKNICLANFPIIDKKLIRSNSNLFLSTEIRERNMVKLKTSGTTGTPFTITSSKTAIQQNYAFFSRFLSWYGVKYNDKHVTFAGRKIIPDRQKQGTYWRHNYSRKQLLCSSYHISNNTIPLYLAAIERFNPTYIDAFPSPIYIISQYILRNKIKHNIKPKVIVTSSEVLTDYHRASIEQAFNCKVADQYGAAEMAGFLAQCPYGNYHPSMEFGIIEVINSNGKPTKPGQIGELICTGFLNEYMPFIRYDTGDKVLLSNTSCDCGRNSIVISKILGRTDDLIITKEGRLISGMGIIFKDIEPINEAQLIQHDFDTIDINIVANRKLNKLEIEQLLYDLKTRIGHVENIKVNYYDSLQRTKGGKFQTVISKVHHELLPNSQ